MLVKATHIIIGILLAMGTLALSGYAIDQNMRLPVSSLQVAVDHRCGNHFIDAGEIRAMVSQIVDMEHHSPLAQGKLKEIEKRVSAMPHVDRAHVYRNIDGALHIRASQRQALLRVVNHQNESYYIDQQGRMMPLHPKYTARALVATGHIHASYSPVVDLQQEKTPDKLVRNERILRDLYQLAVFIHHDNFWSSIIDHIYVTSTGEFELIPKNGSHVVEFGNARQMEEKFEKLMIFYQNGLTRVGWNHYKRINIKFSNQVICSK